MSEFARRHGLQAKRAVRQESVPLWQRYDELKMPLLLIYGREDRGRAAERVELLKQRYPHLNLHVADGCKHLVPWDAADLFHTAGGAASYGFHAVSLSVRGTLPRYRT